MGMWRIFLNVVLVITGLCYIYLLRKVYKLKIISFLSSDSKIRKIILSIALVTGISVSISLILGIVNAVVCIIYTTLIWLVVELVSSFTSLVSRRKIRISSDTRALLAIVCTLGALSYGWYLDHHIYKTTYTIKSSKIDENIKVAMFSDSHLGATFDAAGFSKHMDKVQEENPDMLLIVGDFIDAASSKDTVIECIQRLSRFKTKYGVYFVMGNHDRGYYESSIRGFSEADLIHWLEQNSVNVLRDESKLIAGKLYLIGREDLSSSRRNGVGRKTVKELIQGLDSSKFFLLMDHQPVEYDDVIASKIDLQVSGHTHGGQLFPFNQAVKWFGGNEMVYGMEKRGDTNFIVSSGMSNWALKFKTGTKSEFVIINIETDKISK